MKPQLPLKIKESNRIIAEFMGYPTDKAYSDTNNSRFDKWLVPYKVYWITDNQFEFHKDWNWQIDVARKIFSKLQELTIVPIEACDFHMKYFSAVCTKNHEDCFNILVDTIKLIQNIPVGIGTPVIGNINREGMSVKMAIKH